MRILHTILAIATATLCGCAISKDMDGNGFGREIAMISACAAFRDYQQDCALTITEDEYLACVDNLDSIEETCTLDRRNQYNRALEDLYLCLSTITYCPQDTINETAFGCYQVFESETQSWLPECTP